MINTETNIKTKQQAEEKDVLDNKLLAEMAEAGVLQGHKKSKTHPRMKPYVAVNRHGLDIFDARAVIDSLRKSVAFLKEVISKNGLVIFVGTTPPAKRSIKNLAEELNQPYVITRWVGGTITNFKIIRKRIDYYEELKAKKESGELEKYTKKEQVKFAKEIGRLAQKFDGLVRLTRRPDAFFIIDALEHDTAIREAKHMGIPLLAIIDNDDNPDLIDYPIIASDHSRLGIEWIMNRIKSEILPRPTSPLAKSKAGGNSKSETNPK